MNKRKRVITNQKRELQSAGYEISAERAIRAHTNPQDETLDHIVAKTVAAKVCFESGFCVDSEVAIRDYQADILAYGLEDRRPFVIELETDCDEHTETTKVNQYVDYQTVHECYVIDLDSAPNAPDELFNHIKDKVGL